MKRFLFLALGGLILGAVVLFFKQSRPSPVAAPLLAVSTPTVSSSASSKPVVVPSVDVARPLREESDAASRPARALETSPLAAAVQSLVSPGATYGQKQAVLAEWSKGGKLDELIAGLEHWRAGDPESPECAAALGQAYLQKCATLADVREQALLAMNADKCFDAALELDPENWDARFTKAVAMTHWPVELNKGAEVERQFLTLISQQETRAPQPQFALTYLRMGDEYQKYGRAEDARAIWQRGAALHPGDQRLRSKLTPR